MDDNQQYPNQTNDESASDELPNVTYNAALANDELTPVDPVTVDNAKSFVFNSNPVPNPIPDPPANLPQAPDPIPVQPEQLAIQSQENESLVLNYANNVNTNSSDQEQKTITKKTNIAKPLFLSIALLLFVSISAFGAYYLYNHNNLKKQEMYAASDCPCGCKSCPDDGTWQGPDENCTCWSTLPGQGGVTWAGAGCKVCTGEPTPDNRTPCIDDVICGEGNTCHYNWCVSCSSIGDASTCASHGVACCWHNNSCQAISACSVPPDPKVTVTGDCSSFTVTGGCINPTVTKCFREVETEDECLYGSQLVGCSGGTEKYCEGTHSISPPSTECGVWQVDAQGDGLNCSRTGCNWDINVCNPIITPSPIPSQLTCNSLITNKETPVRGDTLTYTCTGSGSNAGYANFRLIRVLSNSETEVKLSENTVELDTNKIATWSFTLPNTLDFGDFLTQCQICSNNTVSPTQCTDWGQANISQTE